MIPVLIAKLVGAGIPARLAKPLLIVAAVIGAGLILWLVITMLIRNHEEQVIERHDAKVNLDVIERVQRVDKIAADQRVRDAVEAEQSKAELDKVIADETKPIDDRRRALRNCIRLQQAAAKAGVRQPACG